MALPKLEHSIYKLKIPSTGEEFEYRPYTVGEEKILLTALEANEIDDVNIATKNIIQNCLFGKKDVSDLTSYDAEYVFVQLRNVSVGPIVEMRFRNQKCPENNEEPCKEAVVMNIPLDQAKIMIKDEKTDEWSEIDSSKNKIQKDIMLSETIGIRVCHPSMDAINEMINIQSEELAKNFLIQKSVKTVFDQENVYDQFTDEEMQDFVDQMTISQKNKILEFIQQMPVLRYETSFKCKKCGFEEKIEFEGLKSFFE